MSSNQQGCDRKFEQNTLVWFNEVIISEKFVEFMKSELRRIINYVKIFQNIDECVDYILTHDEEHIYFLASSPSVDAIIPHIHEVQQIESIYILGVNAQNSSQSNQTLCKIRGIFEDPIALVETLRQDTSIKGATDDSSTLLFSTLSSNAANRSNQQEAAFMYFRLLTEVLLRLEVKESTKDDFISAYRSQYADDKFKIKQIDKFDRDYTKEEAITWYTSTSFLSGILNDALRNQDIDMLFKFRFFIIDLHNQLARLFEEQSKSMPLPPMVYRGQRMDKNEFDSRIKENIGGLLSVNSFFSTSTETGVARIFANKSGTNDPNTEFVRFEITIEPGKCRRPAAYIKHLSEIEDECEILFSMTPVFRIQSAEYSLKDDFWMVRLLMNGEEDEELNALAMTMKKELGFTNTWSILNDWPTNGEEKYEQLFSAIKSIPIELCYEDILHIFGGLLMKMGDLRNAEYYFRMLINDTQLNNSPMKVAYYTNLSLVYDEQKKYDKAISCAQAALQLEPEHPYLLAIIYNHLGSFYTKKGDVAQAFKYLHDAKDIFTDFRLPRNEELCSLYVNLGSAYEEERNFPKASEYFHKAMNTLPSSWSSNHPNLATIYFSIGTNYMRQEKYEQAVPYLVNSLNIRKRSLPGDHIDIVLNYVNLGTSYHELFNTEAAHDCYQKALKIIEQSPNEPYAPNVMYILGRYHKGENDLPKALDFYHKALDGEMKSTSPDYRFRLAIYTVIAGVYDKQNNLEKAIEYYKNAIPLAVLHATKSLPELYFQIGANYGAMGDCKNALRSFELALVHGREILSGNDPFLTKLQKMRDLLSLITSAMDDKVKTHEE